MHEELPTRWIGSPDPFANLAPTGREVKGRLRDHADHERNGVPVEHHFYDKRRVKKQPIRNMRTGYKKALYAVFLLWKMRRRWRLIYSDPLGPHFNLCAGGTEVAKTQVIGAWIEHREMGSHWGPISTSV